MLLAEMLAETSAIGVKADNNASIRRKFGMLSQDAIQNSFLESVGGFSATSFAFGNEIVLKLW